jgi:hypothetical protein
MKKKKAYLHIDNGGITFKLRSQVLGDQDRLVCPMLVIESKHFVTQTNQMKIPMCAESVRTLITYLENELRSLESSNEYKNAKQNTPLAGRPIEILEK